LNKIRKKENSNNIVWFYPERALRKAILYSTVKTVIALANKKQGQSYNVSRCSLAQRGSIGVYWKPQNRRKNSPKPQNRQKIRPKPKTAYRYTVKADMVVARRVYRAN